MARISPIPTSPRRARSIRSLEIRRLKLARLPTRSPPPRGFTFYLADPISSIAQISADSDFLNQEKRKSGKGAEGFETRSAPALARCYPRNLTFYLGNPFP